MHRYDSKRNRWTAPWTCAAIALALRTLYLLLASREPAFISPGMDAGIYRSWADSILAGHPPAGSFFRAPLYPWLIAALGRVFHNTFWPVRILQITTSSLMAGILAILARRWFGYRAGWIAGLTWALYGASIYFDGEGLIASLYTSGVIGLLWLMDNAGRRRWTLNLFVTGLIFAAITLMRANALAYMPALLLGFWWMGIQMRIPVLRRTWSLLAAALCVFLLLMPVLMHNSRNGGGFTISGQGGINLYLGNHHGANGAYAVDPEYGRDWNREQVDARAANALGHPADRAESSRYYAREAVDFWFNHPAEALSLFARKALALVNFRELGNNRPLHPYLWRISPLFAWLLLLGFPIVVIPALVFNPAAWREQPRVRPAALLAALHGLTVILFFVNARYRLPLVPVLVLLFAFGLDRILPGRTRPTLTRSTKWKRLAAFACVTALVLLPRPVPPIDENEAWALHHANALLRLERYDEARNAFRRLLDDFPAALHAHLNLGVIYLRQDELDSAREQFEAELLSHPENALAWNNLGVAREQTGNPETALDAYRRALRADSTLDDARVNLVRLLARQAGEAAGHENWTPALDLSEEAARLRPDQPEYRFHHAVLLAAAGKIAEADIELRALARRFPDFDPARDALLQLEQQMKNPGP